MNDGVEIILRNERGVRIDYIVYLGIYLYLFYIPGPNCQLPFIITEVPVALSGCSSRLYGWRRQFYARGGTI